MIRNYLDGWLIVCHSNGPVTGRWRATRFGVGMCAGNYEDLVTMIRARASERLILTPKGKKE